MDLRGGVFAHHVQAQEIGGTGLGAGAGHYRNDLARAHVAALFQHLLGKVDHGFSGVGLGAADGRGAPEKIEAVDGDLNGAEREDGRGGVVLGELARRGPRLCKQRDAAQVELVGGVAG